MRLNSILLLFISSILISSTPLPVTKGYFLFPIKPGERNYLSGSMGELRNNHFHGGLDIKTSGKIGLPVYASADGYISKITVEPAGYGKRIAITHPNGYVTHYGHLDHFSEELEKYVLNLQYSKQKFDVDLNLEKDQFMVKRGDVFAYSGNSGSSGGPHLHFEIRDVEDNVYNPLDFGFDEILDTSPPRAYKIALKPLDAKSYVDGSFKKQYYNLGYFNSRFVLNQKISAHGLVGLEIKAYDLMDGTHNKYGIQEIQVWLDGVRHFEQRITSYPMTMTRLINLHVDYQDVYERGDWYTKCYVSNGNQLPFYKYESNKGAFNIKDGKNHSVQVFIKDSYNNTSLLEFEIAGQENDIIPTKRNLLYKPKLNYELDGTEIRFELENVMKEENIDLYSFYSKTILKPVAFTEKSNIYTYNLSKGIPDSIRAADSTYFLPYKYMIIPGNKTEYFFDPVKITFTTGAVIDTLFLTHEFDESSLSIHESLVPLASNMKVEWELKNPLYKNDYQVYYEGKRGKVFLGNNWNGKKVTFYTRSFGRYVLDRDTIAPTVRMIYNTGEEMKLRVQDNLSGIQSYDLFIGDEWILMEYDAKWNLLTSKRKEGSTLLRGPAKFIIRDKAGNEKILELNL